MPQGETVLGPVQVDNDDPEHPEISRAVHAARTSGARSVDPGQPAADPGRETRSSTSGRSTCRAGEQPASRSSGSSSCSPPVKTRCSASTVDDGSEPAASAASAPHRRRRRRADDRRRAARRATTVAGAARPRPPSGSTQAEEALRQGDLGRYQDLIDAGSATSSTRPGPGGQRRRRRAGDVDDHHHDRRRPRRPARRPVADRPASWAPAGLFGGASDCYYLRSGNPRRHPRPAWVPHGQAMRMAVEGIDLGKYKLGWSDTRADYVYKPEEGPERGHRPRHLAAEVRARVDDEVPAERR